MNLSSKIIFLKSLLLGLVFLQAGQVNADNLLSSDLLGNPYQVITTQQGNFNSIDLVHQGSDLLSNIEQIGNENDVTIRNNGDSSASRVSQIGDNNNVSMNLERDDQTVTVIQRGNNMGFKVYQR